MDLLREIGRSLRELLLRLGTLIRRHWKLFLFIALAIGLIFLVFFIQRRRQYRSYRVISSQKLDDASGTGYQLFQNNILAYNTDGNSYMTTAGDLLWSQSYQMSSPHLDAGDVYAVIYDRGGTGIYLFSKEGNRAHITTNLPVAEAKVADNGSIAVLMQNDKVGYLHLYNADGNLTASGEVHLETTGYPVSIAISQDGQRLALALADVSGGKAHSRLQIYDFGAAGKNADKHIVASFDYDDSLIGEIAYVKGGNLAVYTDKKILLYHNHTKPGLLNELPVEGQIRSVYFNQSYFGYVTTSTNAAGQNTLYLYTFNNRGRRVSRAQIDMSYNRVEMLANNEIALYGDKRLEIYNLAGTRKFSGDLKSAVGAVIPGSGSRDYLFVREGSLDHARLK
nr:DUF5711 family protein [Shuttleworthia satelles]